MSAASRFCITHLGNEKRDEREREKDGSKRWPIKVNWAIGQTFKVFLYREIASSDKQVC